MYLIIILAFYHNFYLKSSQGPNSPTVGYHQDFKKKTKQANISNVGHLAGPHEENCFFLKKPKTVAFFLLNTRVKKTLVICWS